VIVEYDVHDVGYSCADSVVRRAFARYDSVRSASNLLVDCVSRLCIKVHAPQCTELIQLHSANRDQGPREHLGVTVFSENISMNMMRIHANVSREQRSEAGRVEGRSRSDHFRRPDAAFGSEAGCKMSHDVYRVRHNEKNRGWRGRDGLRDDFRENRRIAVEQLKPAFAGSLICARSHDHNAAAMQIRVITGMDAHPMSKRHGMEYIVSFSSGPLPVLVHQNNLAANTGHDERERCRRTYESGSDNSYFHSHFLAAYFVLCRNRFPEDKSVAALL